jgi:uncharacterized protein with HEPN domain
MPDAPLRNLLRTVTTNRNFEDYAGNELLRSAVERKFEVMGEALTRIRRDEPSVLSQIHDHRDIISFRNILIHGYDSIDYRIVWGVIQDDLDRLLDDATRLIS